MAKLSLRKINGGKSITIVDDCICGVVSNELYVLVSTEENNQSSVMPLESLIEVYLFPMSNTNSSRLLAYIRGSRPELHPKIHFDYE